MVQVTKIEWTDESWNPIVGCSIVSPGCTHCYAMRMAARIEKMGAGLHYTGLTHKVKGIPVWTGRLAIAPNHIFEEPLRTKRPTMYFVNSMGDLFHEEAPDEWIDRVMAVMALAPRHTFQILTKRPKRMRAYFEERWGDNAFWRVAQLAREGWPELFDDSVLVDANWWPLRNVWLGTSTERQLEADERIPDLLSTPAFVHFISAEPLLGPVDVSDFLTCPVCRGYGFTSRLGDRKGDPCTRCVRLAAKYGKSVESGGFARLKVGLDWVICGGESGPGARPMQPEWARFLRDQCQRAGVPFFLKQMAKRRPIPDDLFIREMPAKEVAA